MLKAIVAKVVRAAAKAGRAFFALPALPPSPRFAPAKVKAVVCKVALMAVLSPAVFIAADEARAQQDIMDDAACALEGKLANDPPTRLCSSTCLDTHVQMGGNCELKADCTADGVTGTVLDENSNTCECPALPAATGQGTPTYPIDGSCQTASAYCTGQGLYERSEIDEEVAFNASGNTANDAYCRICQQSDNHYSFGGNCEIPKTCNLIRGQFVNYPDANNECVCPSGPPVQSASDDRAVLLSDPPSAVGQRTCSPALPSYSNGYDRAACEAAGWNVKFWAVELPDPQGSADRDGNRRGGFHLVESCNIRVQFVDGISLSAQGEIVPESPGEFRNSCILRHNTGADLDGAVGASGSLFCDDGQLFGSAGLPQKPSGFRATPNGDHLFVISTMTADNVNQRIAFDDEYVTPDGTFVPVVDPGTVDPVDPVAPVDPGTGGTPAPVASGGGGGAGPAAGAGILLIGLAYVAFADGDPSSFHITPQAKFEIRNDIPRYSYGTRMEINKDEWTLWWTADESRVGDADGAFGFGYGGAWTRDSLQASASVHTDMEEDVSELRAGLRTEWTLSNWTVRPAYRFRAEVEQGEWTFENGLDLAAQLSQAGWIIRPSVNADLWAAAEPDARLRLQVGREF